MYPTAKPPQKASTSSLLTATTLLKPAQDEPIERWHDLKEVMQIYNINAKSTIYGWIKDGLFMPPAKLGRCSRWATSWLVAHSEALKHGCVEQYIQDHIHHRNDLNHNTQHKNTQRTP